jgi:AraC-like DNA-binding protein
MQIQTYYPQNPLLKKYIKYYYFLKTESGDYATNYYAFPNTLQSFNIHKHGRGEIADNAVCVWGDPKLNPLIVVQGRYDLPLRVQLKGILDKVTIIFEPMGFNHFITSPFLQVAGHPSQIFSEWDHHDSYHPFIESFFGTMNYEERITILEDYLLSKYRPLNEELILDKALELLTDFNNELPVLKIAESINLTPRSFNRLFYKHIGVSPVSFRKIARFRHSLTNKMHYAQFKKLTEIGYESNFFDQSYFIKIYKNLTGSSPSRFFNTVERLANDQLILKQIK